MSTLTPDLFPSQPIITDPSVTARSLPSTLDQKLNLKLGTIVPNSGVGNFRGKRSGLRRSSRHLCVCTLPSICTRQSNYGASVVRPHSLPKVRPTSSVENIVSENESTSIVNDKSISICEKEIDWLSSQKKGSLVT